MTVAKYIKMLQALPRSLRNADVVSMGMDEELYDAHGPRLVTLHRLRAADIVEQCSAPNCTRCHDSRWTTETGVEVQ